MGHPNNKVPAYIEQRIAGLAPLDAALAAGYAQSGIRVTASRLEQREDVRGALRSAKRAQGLGLKAPKNRPVADAPEVDVDALEPWKLREKYASPLELLTDVMNNPKAPTGLRIQCAKDSMPYCHARKEGSKKKDDDDRAKSTAEKSKFGSQAKPSHLQRVS